MRKAPGGKLKIVADFGDETYVLGRPDLQALAQVHAQPDEPGGEQSGCDTDVAALWVAPEQVAPRGGVVRCGHRGLIAYLAAALP